MEKQKIAENLHEPEFYAQTFKAQCDQLPEADGKSGNAHQKCERL